eukprot:11172871-Karenia_brevis.AAC.1
MHQNWHESHDLPQNVCDIFGRPLAIDPSSLISATLLLDAYHKLHRTANQRFRQDLAEPIKEKILNSPHQKSAYRKIKGKFSPPVNALLDEHGRLHTA